jgi:hypothetical protein
VAHWTSGGPPSSLPNHAIELRRALATGNSKRPPLMARTGASAQREPYRGSLRWYGHGAR